MRDYKYKTEVIYPYVTSEFVYNSEIYSLNGSDR